MKTKFEICIYPGAFSPEECKKIVSTFDRKGRINTLEYGNHQSESPKVDEAVRKTKGAAIFKTDPDSGWIRERIFGYCNKANETFKSNITGELNDDLQFLKYSSGGHFTVHRDTAERGRFLLRELSVVVQLSDPDDYRGGELYLQNDANEALFAKDPIIGPKDQGTLVVFHSTLLHQVMPVSRGVRYSLVAWVARHPTIIEKLRGSYID